MSDWIDIAGLHRRDGGFGALLLVRCFSQGRFRFSRGGPADEVCNRAYRSSWIVGNAAVPPYDMQRANRMDGLHACYGMQYVSSVQGVSIIGIGDSIMASAATTGTVSGFGFRACVEISTPFLPVSYFNEGYSGRKSVDYCADGISDIAVLRPQAVLIQVWSENDPWTFEATEASFAAAMRLVDAARQARCVPILVTAAPVFFNRPQAEMFRQASNARVRGLIQSGMRVLDIDRIWGTGEIPNAYLAQYDSGDHTHPNNAAAAAAANDLVPIIREALKLP